MTGITAGRSLQSSAPGEVQISRALLSVSDKAGIVDFARGLSELGIEIISTGGTARALSEAGLEVRSISDLTGFPEVMDGRVKTLHPKLHASLLAVRSNPEHVASARTHAIEPVDLVCSNLYPFERTAATRGVADAEVLENIDIGGPTMIRAAAKNFAFAAPVVSPESYDAILDELRTSDRRLSLQTRESLATEAFAYTARYDAAISRWFQEKHEDFPPQLVRAYQREFELPHGENPHQRAAFYSYVGARHHVLSQVAQLGGAEISFNNLLDLDAARSLLSEFTVPACVIVKHGNPCGAAVATTALEAYQRAFAGDPGSAYGGVIVLNRRLDRAGAEAIVGQFAEAVLACGYDDDALAVLSAKPELRVLDDRERRHAAGSELAFHQVDGGVLVQDRDSSTEDREDMEVVSARRPTDAEWQAMLFAWRVCRHVRSDAVVLARDGATVGLGAGQMSRVDAVRIALEKAALSSPGQADGQLDGAVLASDASFAFIDAPELALAAGITAIIQPGGSVRDPEVIAAADRAGAAMVFTALRHFRH